jgi:transcriptional regulator with GAF, ATPase, and Fis domain
MGNRGKSAKGIGEEARLQRRIAELESRVIELETQEKRYRQAEKLIAIDCAVARILAESTSTSQATARILQTICESIGWRLGDFFSVDPSVNLLRYRESWYRSSAQSERFELASRLYTFPPGIGLPGRVLASGRPNWITDVVKDSNFLRAPVAAEVGFHSACGFPVLVGNEILGVMEFFSSQRQEPDEELLRLMERISSRIGDFNWGYWHGGLQMK